MQLLLKRGLAGCRGYRQKVFKRRTQPACDLNGEPFAQNELSPP